MEVLFSPVVSYIEHLIEGGQGKSVVDGYREQK